MAIFAVLALVPMTVRANPLDTFGYTSAAIGSGGGATASAESYDAAYYNPAGLSGLSRPELGLGTLVYRPLLHASRQDSPPANRTTVLFDAGFATPVPLGKGLDRVLFAGFHVLVPGLTLYAVRAPPRSEPHFPFLEDRNRRLVFDLAVAVKPCRWLSLGAGLSLLPDVFGRVGVDFTGTGQGNATAVDVDMHLAPSAGIRMEPVDGVVLGLAWRGANRTYLSIPVDVRVSDKISRISLKVMAHDYSTPHELALGAAWRIGPVRLSGDVTYQFYRDFRQSAPTVELYESGSMNVSQRAEVADPGFHDAVAVRGGAEWAVRPAWKIRAGFGFQQSPVPAQTGETNLLDGHRFTGAIGAGFDAERLGGPPIVLDAHLAWAFLVSNRDEKQGFDPGNPGWPNIGFGGSVLNAGATVKVGF